MNKNISIILGLIKKYLKRIIIFMGVLILILNTPHFFKSKVKEKLISSIQSKIEADFTYGEISFSSLNYFPHLTVQLTAPKIIGRNQFKNDTLINAKQIAISCNIWELIKNKNIVINKIELDNPIIHLIQDTNNLSNFNILKQSVDTTNAEQEFNLKLNKWQIANGILIYENKKEDSKIIINDIEHQGFGKFKKEFLLTKLNIHLPKVQLIKNGKNIINPLNFKGRIGLKYNKANEKLTIEDHNLKLNDITFSINGTVQKIDQKIDSDITWELKEFKIEHLLQMLPYDIKKFTKDIKSSGLIKCNGHLKGVWGENKIPHIKTVLNINNGHLQYNNIEESIDKINIDLTYENSKEAFNYFTLDIPRIELMLGDKPINGHLMIKEGQELYSKGELETNIKLEDLKKYIPLKGHELKGNLFVDILFDGKIDINKKLFPISNVFISLNEGYYYNDSAKTSFNNITLWATLQNKTTDINSVLLDIGNFHFDIEKDTVDIKGTIEGLENPLINMTIDGIFDIDNINSHINTGIPISGVLVSDLTFKGRKDDFIAKKYTKIKTNGKLYFDNVKYENVIIEKGALNFTSNQIGVENIFGKYNKTNFTIDGVVMDYINLLELSKDKPIICNLNLKCDTLDFRSSQNQKKNIDSSVQTPPFKIPDYLTMIINTQIEKLKIDDLDIDKINTNIMVENQNADIERARVFIGNNPIDIFGVYHSQTNPIHLDVNFIISDMDIEMTYNKAPLLQKLAPALGDTKGNINTTYQLTIPFKNNMTYDLSEIVGKGYFEVNHIEINGLKLMQEISKISKSDALHQNPLKDIIVRIEIKEGKIHLLPFHFNTGKFKVEVSGYHTFENNMFYSLHVSTLPFYKIKFPIHITGNVDKYHVKPGEGFENFDLDELE